MNIAIGTDGSGSNNALSMFREMYLDTVLSNVETNNAAAIDPFTILKAGTSGGALCMGLNDSDVLDTGKKADIIMIDMNKPSMQPENNIVRNIIYSADNSVVKMTMIDGNILYEDGKYKFNSIEAVQGEQYVILDNTVVEDDLVITIMNKSDEIKEYNLIINNEYINDKINKHSIITYVI